MIKDVVTGNIFKGNCDHIAFAINTDGFNDAGFAGQVANYTSVFENTGSQEMGGVITAQAKGKTFHGLVCHSLSPGGWDNTPEAITSALNKIDVPDDTPIGVVLMGGGMIGQMCGADLKENIKAIHKSQKVCIVYSIEYTKEAVLKVIQ